ncbi:MAG TPA: hypothetical protein VJU18_02365 [Vicinamibacteria bacterium]|nr:hypothetical protein [Vicinamibacteria bacterium]
MGSRGAGLLLFVTVVAGALTSSQAAESPEAQAMRARENMAIIAVRTVVVAQKGYAAANHSFYDQIPCLMRPWDCIPGHPTDGAPFLDPTYDWLAPRLGYSWRFHAGPAPTPEEIAVVNASNTSLRAFAFSAAPLKAGETGTRGFCGDSAGNMCVTKDGSEPPVRNGRCDPCKKLE